MTRVDHRAQVVQFELFEFFLLFNLDEQFSTEQFEPTVSQPTVSSPPLNNWLNVFHAVATHLDSLPLACLWEAVPNRACGNYPGARIVISVDAPNSHYSASFLAGNSI